MLKVIIQITPVPAPRQTRSDTWKPRPCVVRYRAYKDELRLQYSLPEDIDSIGIIFHMPMPESWSKNKKSLMDGTPHRHKPDRDNLEKAFWDALLPDSDSHIWCNPMIKLWAHEGSIEIVGIDEIPIRIKRLLK